MSLEQFIKDQKTAFDDSKMPEDATFDFEARLKNELHQGSKPIRRFRAFRYVSIAAGLALLATFGYWYQNEQQRIEVRDQLVASLDKSDTNSSRLEAIYEIEDKFANETEDEKILNAFFKILKADSDANSKIAVIDALLKFPDNKMVRNELIEALESSDADRQRDLNQILQQVYGIALKEKAGQMGEILEVQESQSDDNYELTIRIAH